MDFFKDQLAVMNAMGYIFMIPIIIIVFVAIFKHDLDGDK